MLQIIAAIFTGNLFVGIVLETFLLQREMRLNDGLPSSSDSGNHQESVNWRNRADEATLGISDKSQVEIAELGKDDDFTVEQQQALQRAWERKLMRKVIKKGEVLSSGDFGAHRGSFMVPSEHELVTLNAISRKS